MHFVVNFFPRVTLSMSYPIDRINGMNPRTIPIQAKGSVSQAPDRIPHIENPGRVRP